jgi:hypothetical protein
LGVTSFPQSGVTPKWPCPTPPSAVGQTYHFTPLSFAENMAAMVLSSLIVALAARSLLKVETS